MVPDLAPSSRRGSPSPAWPIALELAREVLAANFQASLDESQLVTALVRAADEDAPRDHPHFLGAGTHFSTWVLPPTQRQQMTLALSVAHHDREAIDRQWQTRWKRAMKQAQKLQIPLLPPFVVVEKGSDIGWVRPYGSAQLDTIGPEWRPLGAYLKQFENALQYQGLAIDDVLQVRVWNDIPFVCDLSDLRLL